MSGKKRKHVSFSEEYIKPDGLSVFADFFNEYMKDVFRLAKRKNGETVVKMLIKNGDVNMLICIRTMLISTILRCQRSESGRVRILPRGGSDLRILRLHCRGLKRNVDHLTFVIDKMMKSDVVV